MPAPAPAGDAPELGHAVHAAAPERLAVVRWRILTRLWWVVSLPSLWLLARDRGWLGRSLWSDPFGFFRFEQWIALCLLILHAWWYARLRFAAPRPAAQHP